MLAKVSRAILEYGRLEKGPPLLVGVSGGPDSLCMLDLLHQLGFSLIVAHVDHQLRAESAQDAHLVAQAASERGLPFVSTQIDVRKYADSNALSLEEAARKARYRFLFDQARDRLAQAVLVGHTADDQVETILMHLFKGAGPAGLSGMRFRTLPNEWSSETPLLRPLLNIRREEILDYCRVRSLQPVLDHSNLDTHFTRNHIRHEILPYLERFYPGLRRRLSQMGDIFQAEEEIFQQVLEAAWQECLLEQGEGFVALDVSAFHAQPVGLQRRLVRRAVGQMGVNLQDFDFSAVERVRHFVDKPSRSRSRDLAAGLQLIMEGASLWIASWNADLPQGNWPALLTANAEDASFRLEVPGELSLPHGWQLRAEVIDEIDYALQEANGNQNPYVAWIDTAGLNLPLLVRTRRRGDRFKMLGMDGHSVKLADLMINLKIPRRARAAWPIVCSGTNIIWVPGLRAGHLFRITGETRQAARLSLSFENGH